MPHSQVFGVDFQHQRATAAIMDTVPEGAILNGTPIRDIIKQIIAAATSANIPWFKIFTAIAIAAAGGFTPTAIAAAIASLFGTNVPTNLKAHA